MVEIAWTMFELLINVIEGILINYFSFSVCNFKFNKSNLYKFVIAVFLYALAMSLMNLNLAFEGFWIIVFPLVTFISLCLFSKAKLSKKLFGAIFGNLLCLISNTATSMLSNVIYTLHIDNRFHAIFNLASSERFLLLILSKLILFCLVIASIKLYKINEFSLKRKEWILIISILLITFILTMAMRILEKSVNDVNSIILIFILELGLIIINIVCFYMVSNLSKSNKQNIDNKLIEEKIETHSKHLKKIRQDQEEIFAIKHDLKSNLQVINNLLRQGKYERAIDYLSEYEESKVFIANETYTDNDMINAVLADKFSLARKQGIEISYQISTDDLLVRDTDICSLLSNMLDNAIEGCSSKETHQKSIKLLMNNTTKQLVISAQNTVAESVLDKNPDLQTSKKGKHGYGTKIIRSIAKAYNGDVDFYEEDGLFFCRVSLYMND